MMPRAISHLPTREPYGTMCYPAALRARYGLSLLEVLISMFILLFGLMGVAAMFPAGIWHVLRADRYDRASAIGQAAFNDIQARGLLSSLPNMSGWVAADGAPLGGPLTPPYAFDPFWTSPITGSPWTAAGFTAHCTRSTMLSPTGVLGGPASRLFVGHDDLTVNYPPDGDQPSLQLMSADQRQFNGHYSWMLTVVPVAVGDPLHKISVPVFFQRVLDREVTITLTGALAAEMGSCQVPIPQGSVPLDGTAAPQLRIGNWILLSGNPTSGPRFFGWYRIVSNDLNGTDYEIYAIGPDHPALNANVTVSIFDSVVAVYEKTMNLEAPSAWGF